MTEHIQQQEFENKTDWRLLALTAIIFIIAEETVRHFAPSSRLETFVSSCGGITLSRYLSKDSKSFAIDAFQSVSITSVTFVSLTLITPFLKNFMPTFLAYGLTVFLLVMSIYAYRKMRQKPVSFRAFFTIGVIIAVLAGALSAFL